MRSFLLAVTAVLLAAPVEAAPKVKFPYEATVEAEEVYVRSGAGSTKYYPTAKLRRGEKVVVHRHDPGGWFMIAPPPGSFSWVPAKYVQKSSAHRGVITANNVAIRVGSFESDIRDVYQRTLAENDEVRIIGEKMLPPETGPGQPELWYRIEPPRGEWRWVPGQAVAPVQLGGLTAGEDPFVAPETDGSPRRSPASRGAHDSSTSFETPLTDETTKEYTAGDTSFGAPLESALSNRPLVRKGGKPEKRQNRKQDDLLDELDRLDVRFRSILDKGPLEWDFDQLERDYVALRAESGSPNIERMIDTRLDRIAGYRKVNSDESELARIQDETSRRDAELAEIQRRQEAQLTSARKPQFDGAGIVNRAALHRRGAPRYALLNQSGKVLAYLVPTPGVDLERWIGRAAGVTGPRAPNPELKADQITVNRLTPVQLTP
ncbi:MAG: hypothetical protein HY290_09760 [Planctomycetia bacterium]|nr:hypothetical protein [Planctomycetia bacterium]